MRLLRILSNVRASTELNENDENKCATKRARVGTADSAVVLYRTYEKEFDFRRSYAYRILSYSSFATRFVRAHAREGPDRFQAARQNFDGRGTVSYHLSEIERKLKMKHKFIPVINISFGIDGKMHKIFLLFT